MIDKSEVDEIEVLMTEEDVQKFLKEGYWEFGNIAGTIEGYLNLSKPCEKCGMHTTHKNENDQYVCVKCP